jgi:putative intracellular protease/amidase
MSKKKKTLAIFYPGCIEFEIMLACELSAKVFPVEVATPGGKVHTGSTGMNFQAHHSFASLQVEDYQCILLPGGDPYDIMDNKDIDQLLVTADQRGILIGAICAGPLLLAKANLLKNRRFTHGYGNWHGDFLAQYWQGAIFTDEPLVVDGNIVTAKPEAHIDFAVEIARLAGAIENQKAEYYRNYYKGNKFVVSTPI